MLGPQAKAQQPSVKDWWILNKTFKLSDGTRSHRWWETWATEWGRKEDWRSSKCRNLSNHLTSHRSTRCNMVVRSKACEIVTTAGGAVELNTAPSVWSVFSHRGAKKAVFTRWVDGGNNNKTCHACHLQDSVLYTRWKQNRTDGTAYGHWAEK